MKDLLPTTKNPGKLKLLVKGQRGVMVTLYLEDGAKIAAVSIFMGMRFTWCEVDNKLVLQGKVDTVEIDLKIDLNDLVELK